MTGALYVSEGKLFEIFRDDEKNEVFMAFCRRVRDKILGNYYVLIPDAFRAKQYSGRDSGRHYASIAFDNFFEWLDFLSERDIKLCIAANVPPEVVIDGNDWRDGAVLRRLYEQSGGEENVVRIS